MSIRFEGRTGLVANILEDLCLVQDPGVRALNPLALCVYVYIKM